MKKFVAKKSLSRLMRKKRKLRIAKAANIQNRGRFCFHARGNNRRLLKVKVRLQLKKKVGRIQLKARPWLAVLL